MSIEEWRRGIDAIDAVLVRLLNERARLACRVGETKQVAGLDLRDPDREREVLDNALRNNDGPLHPEAVERLFRVILSESRRFQAETGPNGKTRVNGR